ncbi:MAG TPA: DUF6600 domain-containing protein [Bacteroidia bacterium]|nr:DUF6600 domain-containing protein [Bacteroidia bacterium]
MKTSHIFRHTIFYLFLSCLSLLSFEKAQAQRVSVQVFYDELSPYGTWIDYPSYGYVWLPSVEAGFSPYATAGHWVWTEDGWLWVSDYDWGWAPFHYGRWYMDDSYGWMWIPGEEWAPAWVAWRTCPGYYGWAPLYPGISIGVTFGDPYYARRDSWVFVQKEYITDPNVSRYYGPRSSNESLLNKSTYISRTAPTSSGRSRYIPGPDRGEVERVTGKPVHAVTIRDNPRPGQTVASNEVRLYRPQVTRGPVNGTRPAPAHVASLREARSPAGRMPAPQQHANNAFPVERTPSGRGVQDPAMNRNNPARNAPAEHSVQPNRQQAPMNHPMQNHPVAPPVHNQPPMPEHREPIPQERPHQEPPMQQRPREMERPMPPHPAPMQAPHEIRVPR